MCAIAILFSLSKSPASLLDVSPRFEAAQVGGTPATHYISPSGADANPGTIDQPWQTFERAFDASQINHVSGGDTLYVRGGGIIRTITASTTGNISPANDQLDGTASQPTRISAYPGEQPIIYDSIPLTSGWQQYTGRSGANIWSINWDQYLKQNYPYVYQNAVLQGNGVPLYHVPQMVVLDGNPPTILQEVDSAKNAFVNQQMPTSPPVIMSVGTNQSDMGAGDFYYESDQSSPNFGNLFVWLPDGGSPNGRPIEVSPSSYLDADFGTQNYVTVTGLAFRYGGVSGLTISGSNNTLDNIDSSYNGFSAGNGSGCISCIVENSTLSHNGNDGGVIMGNGTIYDNDTFDGNNYRKYSSGWHCGGMKLIPYFNDIVVENSLFENTVDCPGLWLDTMGHGNKIHGNKFINNDTTIGRAGLMIEITNGTADDPTLIYDNTFINDGVYSAGSPYVYILNNDFVNGAVRADDRPGIMMFSSHNHVYNNIFYGYTVEPYGGDSPILLQENPSSSAQSVDKTSDYNLFFDPNGTTLNFATDYGHYDALSDWKALGNDIHSVFADPQFINLSGGDYHLLNGSPAIGAATTTVGGISARDIGAYEASTVPVPVQQQPSVSPPTTPLPAIPTGPNIDSINVLASINSAEIDWVTDIPSDSQIEYGLTDSYGSFSNLEAGPFRAHSETITGLVSDTVYHFRVMSRSGAGVESVSDDQTLVTGNALSVPPVQTPAVTLPASPRSAPASSAPVPTSQAPVAQVELPPLPPTQITRNLELGDLGADVLLLQQELNREGYAVATSGPDSPGRETSIFDENTQAAVERYQSSYAGSGIETTGRLDNVTLILINRDLYDYYSGIDESSRGTDASSSAITDSPTGSFLDFLYSALERVGYGFLYFWTDITKKSGL